MRLILLTLIAALSAPLAGAVELAADTTVTRIAFGSCSKQSKPQPIWDAVLTTKPQAFVFLGDNIYGDTRDIKVIEKKYRQLATIEGFATLRATTPVFATWDDHDFGENDAGGEYPLKERSRQAFLRFWDEPESSARWQRDGVYTSYLFGASGRRVQLILLDLRYNRSPIRVDARWGNTDNYDRWASKAEKKGGDVPGPYARNPDPAVSMLGEKQWAWLEAQLREPADVRLIGSSLQVLADFPGWEAWINYSHDQARLFETIRDTGANGVVFVSGDTHYGELSKLDVNVPYPMYDLTTSGLTEEWKVSVPNALRIGKAYNRANFGLVDIDWAQGRIELSLRDVVGKVLLTRTIPFDELRAKS